MSAHYHHPNSISHLSEPGQVFFFNESEGETNVEADLA